MKEICIFDTTLRDGAQGEGISFSLEDKLNITRSLCRLGVSFIEAGNPASNQKDMEYFRRVRDMDTGSSEIVAFGATRKKGITAGEDEGCRSLLAAETRWVTIFGKSWDLHVTDILRTTPEENLAMIRDTIRFFRENGRRVIFDAEHFFDGYKQNREYALETILTARDAEADWVVLCDTNGACFPDEIAEITARVVALPGEVPVGIHPHNDVGCAVASALAAVKAGATQVQGTYIGFGERCGNVNLSTVIANLQLKLGCSCIPPENMRRLTKTARYIAEVANVRLAHGTPYVGKSAFAHKGGMHVDGVSKNSVSFEHMPPEAVGNHRQMLLSEFSGRSAIFARIQELAPTLTRDSLETEQLTEALKEMEFRGYSYETAGASFEIFALKQLGKYVPAFTLDYFKVLGEQPAVNLERSCLAMIKIHVGGTTHLTSEEGDGPVHALDRALRKSLEVFYPALSTVRLIDYKVRVMEGKAATASQVRVLIDSSDGVTAWTTVGVSSDIIDASWQALRDSMEYKLLRDSLEHSSEK